MTDNNTPHEGQFNDDPDSKPTPELDATIQDEVADDTTKPALSSVKTKYRDIDRYRILQKIGEGGMGAVYLAQQEKPIKRQVALKVIKLGANSKKVIARFESERQALALMNHQNIAKILDAGTTEDGLPFFAMELVHGLPLHKYCDQHRLSIAERLELFIPICRAIQHAHQKGIVHRDLKPSNVLIDHNAGQPIAKVIDFGLAKAVDHQNVLSDHSVHTDFGKVVGTVQYMSPEQAVSGKSDVDTRTDIYSLGVILYELLTGSIPLNADTIGDQALLKVLEIIRDQEPPRPSMRLAESSDSISQISDRRNIAPRQLENVLKGDLDWIVMKAIDKDRERRYESVAGLAADINRYLQSDVVTARPPSTSYRLQKFVRRNRLLVGTLAGISLLLVLGAVGTSWFAYQASVAANSEAEQKEIAVKKSDEADQQRRAAFESKNNAEASAKRSAEVLKIVTNSFRSANPNDGASAKMTAREVLENVMKTMESSELDDLGKADLLSTLSASFYGLGEYKRSKAAALEEIALRENVHGLKHSETIVARNSLAMAQTALGENKAALALWEQLLVEAKEVSADDTLGIAEIENNLAVAYARAGRLRESIQLHQKVLKLRTRELGISNFDTLTSMLNLADSLQKASKLDNAKSLLEKTVVEMKQSLPADHPSLMTALGNLAIIYQLNGEFNKSVEQHRFTLDQRKTKLGDEHPDTLANISSLGIALSSAGRSDEAIKLYQEAIPVLDKSLGQTHPIALAIQNNLADALLVVGRTKEAIPIFEKAVEAMTKKFGENHHDTISMRGNLARTYLLDSQIDRAAKIYEDLLEQSDNKLGKEHQTTVIALSNLAVAYSNAGKFEKSLTLTRKAYSATQQVMGEEHPLTLTNLNNLAMVLRSTGKFDEAIKCCKKAFELRTRALGPDHPSSLESSCNLGLLFLDTTQYESAIKLLESSVEKMKKVLGPSHPTTLVVMGNLAVAYQAVGRADEAIALHQESSNALAETVGRDHPRTLLALNNLASSLQSAGELEQAGEILSDVSDRYEKKLGTDHPSTLHSRHTLAYLYWQRKEFEKALELEQATYDARSKLLGPKHPETLESEITIGMIYRDSGNVDTAIEILEKVKSIGVNHNKTMAVRKELQEAYAKGGRTEQLRSLIIEDVEIARKNYSAGSVELANALVLIGVELTKIGEFQRAIDLLTETYEIRTREIPDHWVTDNTQSALGAAYLGLEKIETAKPLLEESFEKLYQKRSQIPAAFRKLRLSDAVDRLIKFADATDGLCFALEKWEEDAGRDCESHGPMIDCGLEFAQDTPKPILQSVLPVAIVTFQISATSTLS